MASGEKTERGKKGARICSLVRSQFGSWTDWGAYLIAREFVSKLFRALPRKPFYLFHDSAALWLVGRFGFALYLATAYSGEMN